MQHDYWLSKWEQGQIGFHERTVNAWLKRFGPTVFAAPGRVFVPLCGKALDLHWLVERGHEVVGVELSATAVRQFFADAALEPRVDDEGELGRYRCGALTIFVGDVFELSPEVLGPVDYVYDRAALIALPRDLRRRYVDTLSALVQGGRRGLLVSLDYDQSRMDGPPFSVPTAELVTLFSGIAAVEQLARDDNALETNAKFRERGLSELAESAYELEWKR